MYSMFEHIYKLNKPKNIPLSMYESHDNPMRAEMTVLLDFSVEGACSSPESIIIWQ
jgi:hypothetical protein